MARPAGDDIEDNDRVYAIKPMNCPGHVQIFKHGLKSYRDLPMRLAEFGIVHRYEPSGALHGLLRVRAFTQDDAHVFCTEDQLADECLKINESDPVDVRRLRLQRDHGEARHPAGGAGRVRRVVGPCRGRCCGAARSDRGAVGRAHQDRRQSGRGDLLRAEARVRAYATRSGATGSAARPRSISTCRSRFGAFYVDSDGEKKTPVMVHRAICGSMERFLGILIENYAGHFPLWLAPVQVVVATITSDADEYARARPRRS